MTRRCEVVLGDAIGFGRERPDIGDDPSQTQIRDNEQRPWRKKRCNRVSRRNDARVATLNVVARSIGSDSTRAAPKLRDTCLSPKQRTRMRGCLKTLRTRKLKLLDHVRRNSNVYTMETRFRRFFSSNCWIVFRGCRALFERERSLDRSKDRAIRTLALEINT